MHRLLHTFMYMEADDVKALVNDMTSVVPLKDTNKFVHMQMTSTSEEVTMNKMCKDSKLFLVFMYIHTFPACRDRLITGGWMSSLHVRDVFIKEIEKQFLYWVMSLTPTGHASSSMSSKSILSDAHYSSSMRLWYIKNC